jgi:nucleotide-binding universal stress UspA family protein
MTMFQFKKILIPTDFSEPSKKAVTYGLTLAGQFNARVIIAHIVPESSALMYAFPTETFAIERDQEQKAQREIASLVPTEYANQFDVQTMVKTGSIEPELLGIVKDERVDLVVMGTHGRRYLGRWFLGSVTERMLRKIPVPLLTVSHVDTVEHTIGLVAIKQILFATDLEEPSNSSFKYAIELARAAHAQLTVTHIVDHMDRMLWGPAFVTRLQGERAKLVQELKERVSNLVAQEKPPDVEIEPLVVEGQPFEKLLEIADERHIDIIVINLQSKTMLERAFLGSTAERVVRLARVPVLSIPVASAT